MHYRMCFMIAVLAILTSIAIAQPPTLWTQTYGGTGSEQSFSVQQTQDGGYIITGYSMINWNYDVYLIKTDALGDTIWTRTFGGSGVEQGESVQQTDDGGYIIAGYTSSYGAGSMDVYLVKTDASGAEEWSQTFGGSSIDWAYSVKQIQDGGYIITGSTQSYGAGSHDVWLIKTDASGNQEWTQTFGGGAYDHGDSVQQTSDGGYIITGVTLSYGAGSYDFWLIKTDASGTEEWNSTFGGTEDDQGNSVDQTGDGGYIIAGHTTSYGAGDYDVYLVKTDASGTEEWSQTFGGWDMDIGQGVQQTSDGGYIIAGNTESYGAGSKDVYLVKTNASGSEEWSQAYGGWDEDQGYSVQQTADGGYITTGMTESYGAGNKDVYLIRLEGEVLPDLSVILTPYNPPIQIPASGGSFDFNIAVSNNGVNPETFDIWTMATLPNGGEFGPIINVPDFTAQAGWTANRDRTQAVPGGAPAGMYTYDAYVGVYPDEVWDEDHFNFEKLETGDGTFVTGWANDGEGFEEWLIEEMVEAPANFLMVNAYPNPFNPVTTIRFDLPEAAKVNLHVYDISGQQVVESTHGWWEAGTHQVTFDGSGLAAGIYVYQLQTSDFTASGKIVLMK